MLVAVKQYLGSRKSEDDLEVEKIVTRWLMTKNTDRYQKGEVKRGL
jgi:hypothetical protein